MIVHIDSPGGTTAGSEQLFDSLSRLREKKPMVVVVDSLAASGGYITALAGDHIVAQQTSLVGSIGVLFQFPNFTDLLDKIGVKVEAIKSTPLKAAPNGFEPTSPEARAAIKSIIKDSYAWFKGLVQDRRHMSDAELAAVDDGRVFTGHQGDRPQADRRARRRAHRARLARQGEERRRQAAGARLRAARAASATCRSCTPPPSALLDAVGLDGAGAAGSRTGHGRSGRAFQS